MSIYYARLDHRNIRASTDRVSTKNMYVYFNYIYM